MTLLRLTPTFNTHQKQTSQPLHAQATTQRSSTQTPSTIHLLTPMLSVLPLQTGNVTTWHFPLAYSQSTLNGRTGSNGCTFIALVLCKLHLAAPELPKPNHPLSSTWVFRMIKALKLEINFMIPALVVIQ